MVLAVAAISVVEQLSNSVRLSSAGASGGVGPYTYQWYKSTTSGFMPGGGNIIAGATSLSLTDTGLIPNTTYYYVLQATDTGDSNATEDSAQKTTLTSGESLSPNQFSQTTVRGVLDLAYNSNTRSVEIDVSETEVLWPGCPVKIVDSAGGVPKVIACTADTDNVLGFINYNIKNATFAAGQMCEISLAGNVMWLYATAAIARGAHVALDIINNGVKPVSGSGGEDIVGWAYDKAAAAGELIRVNLLTPSFLKDA